MKRQGSRLGLGLLTLLVPCWLPWASLKAEPVLVTPEAQRIELSLDASVRADFERRLGPEEALGQTEAWQPYPQYITQDSSGTELKHLWLQFDLDLPGPVPLTRVLTLEDWVRGFRLWRWEQGAWVLLDQKDYLGEGPFPSLLSPYPQVELQIPPGHSRYLVLVENYSTVIRDFALYPPDRFFKKSLQENFSYALILGVLLIMALYNFFLFLSFRSPEGGYFSLYVWTVTLFMVIRDRVLQAWFGLPNPPAWWLDMNFQCLVFVLGFFFQAQYSLKMLGLGSKNRFQLALVYLPLGLLLVSPMVGLFDLTLSQALANNVAALVVLALLGLALFHSFKREPKAVWLLFSITPSVVGGILEDLSLQTHLKLIYNPWLTGICLEIVILSGYLSYRIMVLRREKERADALLLEEAQEHALKLEEKVAQKTKELQHANDTKDKFFSIVAHDLRGPVGSLSLLFNEIITEVDRLDADLLKTIQATTRNTSRFLEELLTWARTQRGDIDFNPKALDLALLVQETVELFSAHASAKGIKLAAPGWGQTWVRADAQMVNAILRNLTNNALKYTDQGGEVRLTAVRQGDFWELEVVDSGTGMPPSVRQGLFQIDSKATSSPGTRSEAGTGLGLILCREFVEKNGGKIGVESELGQGSRFWFTLPSTEAPDAGQRQALLARIKGVRVLLAEDNPLHQETSLKVLKDLGLKVQLAVNGLEAAALYKAEAFRLILMDVDMPELNGIEATKRILAERETPPVVVSLSSYSRRELDERAQGLFAAHLHKPLDKEALLAVCEEFLAK